MAQEASAAESAAERPEPRMWCARCGKRVLLAAGAAVHAATLARAGSPDGHDAMAVSEEPPLWKAAREIEADYGGAFTVSARFGFLRADWAAWSGKGTPAHYEAPGEDGLRRQLDAVARRGRREAGAA